MKTPYQIAWGTLADNAIQPTDKRTGNTIAKLIEQGIEADRKQRAGMAAFGRFVYETMNATEWSSDTFDDIAVYAADVLKKPFSEPDDD